MKIVTGSRRSKALNSLLSMAQESTVLLTEQTDVTTQAVMECQQHFWQALQAKDAQLLLHLLADDFVCYSPNQAPQSRAAFVATIVEMPVNVIRISAQQVALRLFDDIAVLTGVQIAHLSLPGRTPFLERLALTNIFRQNGEVWQMVVAHPIALVEETST